MSDTGKNYILIVDDTETNLRVLGSLLRAEGWSVAAATDGAQALALIARRRPDLLLLDVMMPGLDGFEVCRRLRADPATRDLPILFITALTEEESIVRAFSEGGQDYIMKPFRHAELVARVRTHLALLASRRRAEIQAGELARLNADKDRFFSIIAHDLRSPLGGLHGLSEAIAENPREFSPEEIAEMATEMAKSARNVYQLLENLLEWARLQTGRMECHPEEFDISVLLHELVELFRPTARQKGIEVTLHAAPVRVWSDRSMVFTVFRNLLSNAIKFTARGGSVGLRAHGVDGRVVTEVSDNGLGLTPAQVEKLFAPGTKPTSRLGTANEPGTGLGLVLCAELVQRNGGTLTVTSEAGRGSVFVVTLPRPATPPPGR